MATKCGHCGATLDRVTRLATLWDRGVRTEDLPPTLCPNSPTGMHIFTSLFVPDDDLHRCPICNSMLTSWGFCAHCEDMPDAGDFYDAGVMA